MSFVWDIVEGIKKTIPVLVAKTFSVLLLIFTAGMFLGYRLAEQDFNFMVFIIPLLSLVVIWRKLDEGMLVLFLLVAFFFIAPEFFM